MKNNTLVTVIVITYNSSAFVVETLESIKNQRLKNVELVISDDCSTDNTYFLCENWLIHNSKYFINSKLIKTDRNKGIAGNCNNGLSHSNGDWIKIIAGDDLLFPNCISNFIKYINNHTEEYFLFCECIIEYPGQLYKLAPVSKNIKTNNTRKQELLLLKQSAFFLASGGFYSREKLIKINGFDENYPFMEDFPLYLNILKAKYKISFPDFVGVIYRIHETNISLNINNPNSNKFNSDITNFARNILVKRCARRFNILYAWYYYNQSRVFPDTRKDNQFYTKLLRIIIDPVYLHKVITHHFCPQRSGSPITNPLHSSVI